MSPLFPSGPRSLPAALRDLRDARPKIRLAAVEDLPRHAEEHRSEVVDALTRVLGRADESPEVRSAAALGLADVRAVESVDVLLDACSEQAPWQVRQMAVAALGELGASQAATHVAEALGDDRAEVRFQAVMAFPRVSAERAEIVERLLEASRDPDPTICHMALRMSEELGPDEPQAEIVVARPLLDRARELLDHETSLVRVAAAIILGRSGQDDGDELLVDVVDGRVQTREVEDEAAAIDLCGERGLTQAIPALEKRAFGSWLGLRSDPFAWQARVALAALGHKRAVQWVMAGLRARSRNQRTLAVAAAGRAKLESARAALERLRDEPGLVDPDIVADALRAFEGTDPPSRADE